MKLINALDTQFKSALASLISGKIPMKTAFKLKGILNTINAELAKYEEVRQLTLKKYVELKEDGSLMADEVGNVIFKSEEDGKAFFAELNETVSTEIAIAKVKLSELGDLEKIGVHISVEELGKLETILDLEQDEPAKLATPSADQPTKQ